MGAVMTVDSTMALIIGLVTGAMITLTAVIVLDKDKDRRIVELERKQEILVHMLTYIPEQDIPEVVKTIRPKAAGKGADE
jgi:uncharacterized spore protein YtfJ